MLEIKNIETFFPDKTVDDFIHKDDFLSSISVIWDMKGNGVFMPEFQRYGKTANCGIVMSQSTMHSMNKFMTSDYDPFTKYVTPETKQHIKDLYQQWVDVKNEFDSCSQDKKDLYKIKVYESFERLVHNLPRGFELWTTITTNYLQLKTIVIQRKNHKNIEDWGAFIQTCYTLPDFRKLCKLEDSKWDISNIFPQLKILQGDKTNENN